MPWLVCLVALGAAGPDSSATPYVLHYDHPAGQWTEALPVGNGRLGAMVFGGVPEERIQFNEATLWAGGPHDYSHPGAADYLGELRKLLWADKQREAEQLAADKFMSEPLRQVPFLPCGDLTLSFPGQGDFTHYDRRLDLDTAIATTRWTVGDATFERQVLASYPARAIVVRVQCDRPGRLRLAARLTSPHAGSQTAALGANGLALRGRVGDWEMKRIPGVVIPGTLRFEARLQAAVEGGKLAASDDRLEIEGADAATLLLTAATSHVNCRDTSADPAQRCGQILAKLQGRNYAALRDEHLADHQGLFRRVALDLGPATADGQNTDQRLASYHEQPEPALAALVFQFGRYLLIACSRPGGQPANLQGVWNESMDPPWDSKYTVNINTEMNYWPAEVANLAPCTQPLFDALDEVAQSGRRTAQVHYQAQGWVLHHNFDLWRGTAPINNASHGIWPTGGAWLCQHLWWHYLYSNDREFLARQAYPLMKQAALFFLDYLVEDPVFGKGWLTSGPSNSPEHGGLVMGPTMDHQIVRHLLGSTAQAAEILGVDAELRTKLLAAAERIAPNQIGEEGNLKEWLYKDLPKANHRHLSHLWGLYPGEEITPETPELFQAARQSLILRGEEGTGWSSAWKVSLWARLLDGDRAGRAANHLLKLTGAPPATKLFGGLLPNLFDSCPPFQIDGNFGFTAGICEMLLQSHRRDADGTPCLDLLPALSPQWPAGRVTGLRGRGGVEVDMRWQDGRLAGATLRSPSAQRYKIRAAGQAAVVDLRAGQTVQLDGKLMPIAP